MERWKRTRVTCLALGMLASALLSGTAKAQTISGGPGQTTLIELFTSEGCSSCPPAEAYLNSFREHPLLWKKYIPLALHVDYWDYLGWKDRFATPLNTTRQRQYARTNHQSSIYTPGFYVNGQPWRRGIFGREPDVTRVQTGTLKLEVKSGEISARFEPVQKIDADLILHVAILGMGFSTDIGAGEREGSRARHDFTQLKHVTATSDNLMWQIPIPDYDSKGASRVALVAWINRQNNPRPIQAAGGYLD